MAGFIDLIAETPAGYRGFVTNFYMDLQKKYYDSLLAELRLSLVDDEIVIHEPMPRITHQVPYVTMTGDMVEEDNVAEEQDDATKVAPVPEESVVKPTTTKYVAGADALLAEATAADESADVTVTADVEEADDVLEEDAVVAEIVVAEELEVEPTATNVEAVVERTATNVEAVAKPTATIVEVVVEPTTTDGGATIDDVRATSMEMKNKRQEASAMKAIKHLVKKQSQQVQQSGQ